MNKKSSGFWIHSKVEQEVSNCLLVPRFLFSFFVSVCGETVKVGYRVSPGKLGEPTTWLIVFDLQGMEIHSLKKCYIKHLFLVYTVYCGPLWAREGSIIADPLPHPHP